MKKLTLILVVFTALLISVSFVFNFLNITNAKLYTAQQLAIEEEKAAAAAKAQEEAAKLSEEEGFELPSYYNAADIGKASIGHDQGELGACWAFAALTSLEGYFLPAESLDFSEDHMLYNNAFDLPVEDGGDYIMAVAYLSSWTGPVAEADDPYNDGQTNASAAAIKHVQDVMFINGKDYESIKKCVYKYGAVESSIFISVDENMYIDNTYYNPDKNTYCYLGDYEANHEIVIIGWDDSFPAENFYTKIDGDGAFICMNSWGSDFGDNGIFYVSYYDSRIGDIAEAYSRVDGVDNYDNIYQYDECGWVGRIGFDDPKAYFANVFTASSSELLRAVSFYATGDDTSYTVYVCNDFDGTTKMFRDPSVYASGHFDKAGYYTVDLDTPVEIEAGEKFAVIVKVTTTGSNHPVAIEMNAGDGRTDNVTTEGKESYVSADGWNWERTQEESQCNVCLKAFTDNVE